MTTAQKIIKGCAVCLAIFLIVSIISGILTAIYSLAINTGLIGDDATNKTEEVEQQYSYDNIYTYLDIDLKYTNLKVLKGDSLSIKTNDKSINITEDSNKLIVKETRKNTIIRKKLNNLEIYLPESLDFEKVNIKNGAGEVYLEDITTNKLDLELGAGKTIIKNLTSSETKIETGAGSVSLRNCNLNNLNLDLGVGEVAIDGIITGRSNINSGIGEVILNLDQSASEYTFDIDKGIGTITLNDYSLSGSSIIGTGENYLKIDGGIGEITIRTLD